jgi:Protein of unknown function (DUF1549)/Protein of unknown function (DUF1553)
MNQLLNRVGSCRRGRILFLIVLGAAISLGQSPSRAGPGGPNKKPQPVKPPVVKKPLAPAPPRSALLTVQDWQKVALAPLREGEIDQLVARELEVGKVEPAPITIDEQFLRRVTLDLTGELPMPADVAEFVSDPDPRKRSRLIDKLLESDEYARHWTHYWREVMSARLTDRRSLVLVRAFDLWFFDQLKRNEGWDKIVQAMITAEGSARFDDDGKSGPAFFLAAHRGNDAANERAAETSRVFLGIQIQCAQCHDHPSDQWKRVQFHELAAYFARLNQRPLREDGKLVGLRLISMAKGEHEMPSKEDPKKAFQTDPRFLDGRGPGPNASDQDRRRALANAIVEKSNYWFAAAYVNRIWGELMGQSFYQPVDDMGPKKEVVFPQVLTRLTGAFRANNYDIKQLFRDIMKSETYQRQIRLSGSSDQHLHFAAAYPTRLPSDSLWQSLVNVLGTLGVDARPKLGAKRPYQQGGFEFLFKEEFGFDPSLKAGEVEGSITQALLMMNNPVLHQRIQAAGTNLLARILKSYPQNDEALRILYLRTLARTPTDREVEKCRTYIAETGRRIEAFEDILWSLLNSTEFLTKR